MPTRLPFTVNDCSDTDKKRVKLYTERKERTCIAPIVSISTTKRSDVDHTELPANTPHLPFIRWRATLLLTEEQATHFVHNLIT